MNSMLGDQVAEGTSMYSAPVTCQAMRREVGGDVRQRRCSGKGLGLEDGYARSKNGEYHKERVKKHECVGTRHRKVRDMVKL